MPTSGAEPFADILTVRISYFAVHRIATLVAVGHRREQQTAWIAYDALMFSGRTEVMPLLIAGASSISK